MAAPDVQPAPWVSPVTEQRPPSADGASSVATEAVPAGRPADFTDVVRPSVGTDATAHETAPSPAQPETGASATASPAAMDTDSGRTPALGSWPGSLTPTIPAGDLPTLSPLAGPKDDKRPDVTVSIGRIEVVPPPEPKPPPTAAPLGKAATAPDLAEYLRSRSDR